MENKISQKTFLLYTVPLYKFSNAYVVVYKFLYTIFILTADLLKASIFKILKPWFAYFISTHCDVSRRTLRDFRNTSARSTSLLILPPFFTVF